MRAHARRGAALLALLFWSVADGAGASATTLKVDAGSLVAVIRADPWRVEYRQPKGPTLVQAAGPATATPLRARELHQAGDAVVARVETAAGRVLAMRIAPVRDGVLEVTAQAPDGSAATAATFASAPGERFYGTGERSDSVTRNGRVTENYVADGPVRPEDRLFVKASVPPWADRDRDDATYYPVPWLLSSRGYGVQIAQDATSRFVTTGGSWSAEADGAQLTLRVFAGPTPAQALERYTELVGRQPEPKAAWTFGPWFQTGQPNVIPFEEERAIVAAQRRAGAPVSVAETQMHHLPCGAHTSRREEERARTDAFHREGLARLVYFNPSLCVSYTDVFTRARAAGVLQRTPVGEPFVFPAFVGGAGPLGFTEEPLAQFDFRNPATEDFYAALVKEAVDLGADGWMEDFGEGTPPAAVAHDGATGAPAHNRYPTDYHCALARIAARFGRPLVRFQRSGWTGTARCADVVWGGDPTTVWGFDGLASVPTQLLSIGLSGVARWATDIGGYVSFGAGSRGLKPGETEEERLTPELLTRWMEIGALIPVMRTKRSGIALPSYERPQVFDPDQLPHWRRLTELHLQLNPYLRAADDEHRASGLPIARHMILAYPDEPGALDAGDQWLLGPDLLVAPVLRPGARERRVWVPPGEWVDWWRSVRFDEAGGGAYRLATLARVRGGGPVTVAGPLGQPPLLLRAGALIPLLGADVDTLSDHGAGSGLVRLADRRDRLRLLAVPRGRSRARLPDGGTARSRTTRRGWRLELRMPRRTRWEIEASLAMLRPPRRVHSVRVNGKVLPRRRWRYRRASRVLTVSARGRRVVVDVR